MIFAICDSLFVRKNIIMTLQASSNFAFMFSWEVLMLFPERTFVRHTPSYIQDFLVVGLFTASFGGAYMDFYYSKPILDLVMHTVGGVACTLLGYELVTAMQKRDKSETNIPLMVFCAFCFSFFAGTVWELFEFTFDQVAPAIGDAQHWSKELAQQAADKYGIGLPNVIPARDDMRYAVIDTMEDTICNTVGGVIGWVILKIKPYHHLKEKNGVKN